MLILAFSFEKKIAKAVADDQSGSKVRQLPVRTGNNSHTPVAATCVPFEESYCEVFYWNSENNLHAAWRRSKNNLSQIALIRESSVAEPEGAPRRRENEIGFQEVTNACDACVELESRGSASCDESQFLLKTRGTTYSTQELQEESACQKPGSHSRELTRLNVTVTGCYSRSPT
jgi:hypothetical protein